ncbi:hypothetical protein BDB00DRAFT_604924 [Zychaea mexicana]|uniref:uncharacterized protein n=1 Tax=Zychaea mexicana TaxID=64656 RepID=UPI0022FE571E|nr:uncharacterized protein BDB00DRAFT_604924 [Zychaea mexicana]KAI9489608.1 hypothetical protein BDB00DRAFT_604924 [Zychaea mexicana]
MVHISLSLSLSLSLSDRYSPFPFSLFCSLCACACACTVVVVVVEDGVGAHIIYISYHRLAFLFSCAPFLLLLLMVHTFADIDDTLPFSYQRVT